MKHPINTTPVRLEGGIIARLKPKSDGGAVSEVFDGKAWVRGASIDDVLFNGSILTPTEIAALGLLDLP